MVGFRFCTTSAVIGAASLLAYQTGADAVSHGHLRKLNADDYTNLGCFKDNLDDRILGYLLVDENTTPDFCYDYCVSKNAPLMATQNGMECWCATEVEIDYGRHGDGAQCNTPCAGDENKMCGGGFAIDLYRIESINTPSEPEKIPDETPEETPGEKPEGALHEDIVKIIEVKGRSPGGSAWADSYSVGDKCYIKTTFDHEVDHIQVDTPRGTMTIGELFGILAPGPGSNGRPLYNDIQCGNGPPNTESDEVDCPGLVEYGREGCGEIGPMWDLSELE